MNKTSNIIDLDEYNEEILFSSLTKQEQEDYLICCDKEMKEELRKEGATIPKPINLVLGLENA
jgi:hypothetical protein